MDALMSVTKTSGTDIYLWGGYQKQNIFANVNLMRVERKWFVQKKHDNIRWV